VEHVDERAQHLGSGLEHLAVCAIAVLRDDHVGQLGCQIDGGGFQLRRIDFSQSAARSSTDNKVTGISVNRIGVSGQIGKIVGTINIA
jgi:hypothetical protein